MIPRHDTGTKIQVYLRPAERNRLERLTARLGASKSGVVRRGLEALERQLTDPHQHTAMPGDVLSNGGIVPEGAAQPGRSTDVARRHDDVLAEDEIASWSRRPRPPKPPLLPHDSE